MPVMRIWGYMEYLLKMLQKVGPQPAHNKMEVFGSAGSGFQPPKLPKYQKLLGSHHSGVTL